MRRPSVLARFASSLLLIFALTSGCGGAPDLTEGDEAILSARAVAEICAAKCGALTIYVVSGQIFGTVGEENQLPVSADLMSAINDRLGQEVLFVDHRRVDELVVDGQLVDREGIIVFVGPVTWLSSDVVGVQIGSHSADDGAWGGTQQFRWTGQAWEPADSEDTGITTVTMVS